MSGKTLVLGFDALDFEYLNRFSDELPNFASLRSKGVATPLASTMPPWTGSAWPSMYTGVDPSYHSVYDFFSHDARAPTESTLITRNDVRAPALWNYLTEKNRQSIVLNLPVTHPVEEINGVIVPGYLAPEKAPGYPANIRSEISQAIGETYRIYAEYELSNDAEKKLNDYVNLIEMRTKAAKYLLTNYEWDVGIIQVQKTDAVFHNFDTDEEFLQVYKKADEFVGELVSIVDTDDTIIVCSDHGIGPANGYTIYINEILRDAGYVETTTTRHDHSLRSAKQTLTQVNRSDRTESTTTAIQHTVRLLRGMGISPGQMYAVLQRVGLGEITLSMLPYNVKKAIEVVVEVESSVAYCRSSSELGIRLNVKGREASGIVDLNEYETIRDEIIELLSTIETPDGESAFERVVRREDVYSGPYTNSACDILFYPNKMNNPVKTKLFGKRFIKTNVFDHKTVGVFIGSGPAFNLDWNGSLELIDVAPITLATADVPVPTRMTGRVPSKLVRKDIEYDEYESLTYRTGEVDNVLDDQIEDRLSDLGYL
ncbi:alkaline phosphatase family protein [Haladaptatus sp. GCM10025707]|uniref:alkaline phosphatase family protein n=1 Tax=unclassified Haladaptatus TaxID=2622732 RepID=UPI0023E8BB1C|nr:MULTISPECIES: alkaline phosphatase family protein [unclassified Haladaptatus]